jgi:hypothetical protein
MPWMTLAPPADNPWMTSVMDTSTAPVTVEASYSYSPGEAMAASVSVDTGPRQRVLSTDEDDQEVKEPAQASGPPLTSEEKEELHLRNECRPCAYFHNKEDGCRLGDKCQCCHLCPPDEIRKRKKARKKQAKELRVQAKGEAEICLELRGQFKKEWQIFSTPDNSEINLQAVASFLKSINLHEAAESTPVKALATLLTYIKGDMGGLEVKESLLEGAGRGLFSMRKFFPGDLICVYSGELVPLVRVMRGEVLTDYLMGGFGLYSIDAANHPAVKARYINDNFELGSHNVKFVKLKLQRRALVIALREIEPGDELYAFYGEGYWRKRGLEPPLQPSMN